MGCPKFDSIVRQRKKRESVEAYHSKSSPNAIGVPDQPESCVNAFVCKPAAYHAEYCIPHHLEIVCCQVF